MPNLAFLNSGCTSNCYIPILDTWSIKSTRQALRICERDSRAHPISTRKDYHQSYKQENQNMTKDEQLLSTDEPFSADPTPQVSSFNGGLSQYAFSPTSTPPNRGGTTADSLAARTSSPLTRSHLKRKASSPTSTLSPSPSPSPSPGPKKAKRSPSGYAPPSKYAHLQNNLIDSLTPNLICVFIGVNPGLQTATAGHAYAHPSNLFWKLLHTSGCTPRRCRPDEDRDLPRLYSMGHTNIVARATKDASELSRAEMDAGVPVLEAKIATFRPEAVCIVGKGIWESIWRVRYGRAIRKGEFVYGWQGERDRMGVVRGGEDGWGGARVFVATTTSGLAAGMRLPEKEAVWRELGVWVEKRREERKGGEVHEVEVEPPETKNRTSGAIVEA